MPRLQHVPVGPMDPHRFADVLPAEDYEKLLDLIERGARELRGRVIWNVSSTAKGGGVVELVRPLLGYSRGGGVDARWVVIGGEPEFFAITKRLHNHLHGFGGDGGELGARERAIYERLLACAAAELAPLLRARDVVILHDPQTAGLVDALRRTGATVIWRCHVGRDHANQYAHQAWGFLRGYVLNADAFVFSRGAFAWEGLPEDRIAVIQPSIDALSPKNADQTPGQSQAILSRAGIVPDHAANATFTRSDGTPGRVDRRAEMIEVRPLEQNDVLVTQVSRWDRLKDPLGVLSAFAEHIADTTAAHLLLAGPSTESVADDPEGADVFASVQAAWRRLPQDIRRRVHLASLPLQDIEENAAIVNALQRHSDVVVQKSLAEGFGLTVAEAMWKQRPVVASRIGGIQDQIVDGESGILIAHPRDLAEFSSAVTGLLSDPERARRIGQAAHLRVRDHFLGPHHLARYFELIQHLVSGRDQTVHGESLPPSERPSHHTPTQGARR
jgi:trehalose synthase